MTKNAQATFLALVLILGLAAAAIAEQPAVNDDVVVKHVQMTATAMEKNVTEVFAAIDAGKPPYVDKDNPALYSFVYNLDVTLVSHPNPKIRGKNLKGVPDAGGKDFRDEIIQGAKKNGSGWVFYEYKKPGSDKLFNKKTYYHLVKAGDGKQYVVCCGEYLNTVK